MPSNRKVSVLTAILIVTTPLVYILSNFTSANRVTLSEAYEDSDLDLQGRRLKGFALGSEGLLADWYWMRSLQYIGDKLVKNEMETINIEDLQPLNPRLLYPLLDNATDLDSKFIGAYSYGAVVLPAIDPSLAVKLAEKGIANNPESWRLYQYLGYIHWRNKDYELASATYERGSYIAGAPSFMREMAAAMKNKGGSRNTARLMYQQIFDDAQDEQSRRNAELRLMQLAALDELDVINSIVRSFQEKSGRCPTSLKEILAQLSAKSPPGGIEFHMNAAPELTDPTGVPYLLNQNTCGAVIDAAKSRIPPN